MCGTKEGNPIKFNDRIDANCFVFNVDELYHRLTKAPQLERRAICDYDAVQCIEKNLHRTEACGQLEKTP